jgi:hypothetical protein
MTIDNTQERPGHLWHPTEENKSDKGEEFVDPLTQHVGTRWIDSEKTPEFSDDGDIRAGERRGAVVDNRSQVKNASEGRVKNQ